MQAPACGQEGKPCCLLPSLTMTRAGCSKGLACTVRSPMPLPFGGVSHLKQLAGSRAGVKPLLLDTAIMGVCR
jgi:hypothetical protein